MNMDFTEQELEIIFDALEEKRLVSEDDDEALLIETIFDKIWKATRSNG